MKTLRTVVFGLIYICLWAFICEHVIVFNCAAMELDADIWERLDPFRVPRLSPEKIKELREELFRVPDLDNRLGKTLAKLAVESRYDGTRDRRMMEIQPLVERRDKGAMLPDDDRKLIEYAKWLQKESPVVGKASEPRAQIYRIMRALGNVADARVVRFIAPLLAERSEIIDRYSDAPTRPAQDKAADAMGLLIVRGVNLPGAPKGYDLEEWRKWWKEHRAEYEPIPPALAALEATEGGTKSPPPPPPAPAPTTPTPQNTPTPATPTPAIQPTVQPVTVASSQGLSPLWLAVLPVVILLALFLARRR